MHLWLPVISLEGYQKNNKTSWFICLSTVRSAVCAGSHWRKHQLSLSLAFCEGTPRVTGGFPSQRNSNGASVSISWHHHVAFQHSYVKACQVLLGNHLVTNTVSSCELLQEHRVSNCFYLFIAPSFGADNLIKILVPLWNLNDVAEVGLPSSRGI